DVLNKNLKAMSKVTFKEDAVNTQGSFLDLGTEARNFSLTASEWSQKSLDDSKGKRVVLNIFLSLATGVCSASVREFNQRASNLDNTVVLCISRDLPFAHARFCSTEGLNEVIGLSEYKDSNFSDAYGVRFADGPLEGLLSRSVVVIDE